MFLDRHVTLRIVMCRQSGTTSDDPKCLDRSPELVLLFSHAIHFHVSCRECAGSISCLTCKKNLLNKTRRREKQHFNGSRVPACPNTQIMVPKSLLLCALCGPRVPRGQALPGDAGRAAGGYHEGAGRWGARVGGSWGRCSPDLSPKEEQPAVIRARGAIHGGRKSGCPATPFDGTFHTTPSSVTPGKKDPFLDCVSLL